jgi:hypothetical protein
MSQSANVRSIEALKEFKNGLIAFADDARVIIDGVDMEVRRTRNWLERDQLAYWRTQVKRRQEDVAAARTELHRRKISQMNSDAISDTEQKEALKLAQRRLVEAEEKVETIKRWIPVLEHAIHEYHSQVQPLGDHLAGGFENTLSLMDRMVDALEAYLSLRAPEAPRLPPVEGTSSAAQAAAPGMATAANAAPAGPESGSEEAGGATEAEPDAVGTAPSEDRGESPPHAGQNPERVEEPV